MEFEKFKNYTIKVFEFLISEFNMKLSKELQNGNTFYDINYSDKTKIISISLETVENHYSVIIFKLHNGMMPDYDDKSKTLHLNYLNNKYSKVISKEDRNENNLYFQNIESKNETERMILKSAKDLRLCWKKFTGVEN